MKRITTLMLAGLATIGATAWALTAAGTDAPATAQATAATQQPVAAPGRVEPYTEEVQIGAELSGRLARVLVDEGDRVRAGDLLAELEGNDYRARLASAAARVQAAQADYDRLINGARSEERREAEAQRLQAEAAATQAGNEYRRRASLYQNGAIALEEMERAERDRRAADGKLAEATERARVVSATARDDERARARANIALATAAVDEARALLAKTAIRAPQDATIIRRHHRAGELVSPETGALFTIADTSRLRVRVEVDETDVARLSLGQPVSLRADAYGDRRFAGRVSRIGLSLGRKNVRTDRPTEKTDTSVLETLVDLDPGVTLPLGLRVDVFIGD